MKTNTKDEHSGVEGNYRYYEAPNVPIDRVFAQTNDGTRYELREVTHLKEQHERRERELRNLWLDIEFLDKYSEDEHYWNESMGNNHCVEMHISDFERLRNIITKET